MWRRALMAGARRAAATQCLESSAASALLPGRAPAITAWGCRSSSATASGTRHMLGLGAIAGQRCFAASGGPASLEAVLKAELAHELEHYDTPELVKQGPPEPFDLHEEAGGRVLTLTRRIGDETVTVTVSVEDEPDEGPWTGGDEDYDDDDEAEQARGKDGSAEDEDEDEDEDNGDDLAVFFDVRVTKQRGPALVFECVTDGVNVDIMSVQLRPEGQQQQPDTAYGGPEFSTLDVALQDSFATYLADRGVDHVLAEYLVELSIDKEQREYVNWLKACAKFVGGGK